MLGKFAYKKKNVRDTWKLKCWINCDQICKVYYKNVHIYLIKNSIYLLVYL